MAEEIFGEEIMSDRERKNWVILDLIRRKGPITRTEISKETQLNIVTVSNYINSYIQKGLVLEGGLDVSSGGRRPVMVELNPKAGFVVGVGLDLFNIIGLTTDLQANVLVKVKKPRPVGSEDMVIDNIVDLVDELMKKSELEPSKIKGLGVGIPGIIDRRVGTIRWPNQMGSIYISTLKSLLEQKFGIPTFIENDATVAACGERELELETGVQNLIFMYSGVGSGIIINGQVYRGASGCAGELGIANFTEDEKHKWGGMARWEADLGLTTRAIEAIKKGEKTRIFDLANGDVNKITMKTVVEAAKEGDALADKLVEEAGIELGIRIAYLVNFLNPEVVVIGGGIERAGAVLLDAIKRTVRARAFEEMANVVRIVPTQLGEDSVAMGAVSLVIQEIFTHVML
ncbi:MAG: ROK family transcriptional regulator [Candidatus Omnitrophica bacterium]|nr:ROK family transcriptional regulator [Candidatus Omnitrophota bacterium]